MFCRNCGNAISDRAKFCKSCGKEVVRRNRPNQDRVGAIPVPLPVPPLSRPAAEVQTQQPTEYTSPPAQPPSQPAATVRTQQRAYNPPENQPTIRQAPQQPTYSSPTHTTNTKQGVFTSVGNKADSVVQSVQNNIKSGDYSSVTNKAGSFYQSVLNVINFCLHSSRRMYTFAGIGCVVVIVAAIFIFSGSGGRTSEFEGIWVSERIHNFDDRVIPDMTMEFRGNRLAVSVVTPTFILNPAEIESEILSGPHPHMIGTTNAMILQVGGGTFTTYHYEWGGFTLEVIWDDPDMMPERISGSITSNIIDCLSEALALPKATAKRSRGSNHRLSAAMPLVGFSRQTHQL